MTVVNRGEVKKLIAPQALFLIVDETVLEVKAANKDAILADQESLKAELTVSDVNATSTRARKTA